MRVIEAGALRAVVVAVAVGGCGEAARTVAAETPGARAATRAAYLEAPTAYWARRGLPPLVRRAGALEDMGVVAGATVFEPLMARFDAARFEARVETGALTPAAVAARAAARLGGLDAPQVWLTLVRDLVDELDLRVPFTLAPDREAAWRALEALVDAGFDPEALLALAPLLKDALRDELPDALCLAGSDPLSTPAGAGGGALEVRWREIEDASVWASEHNAACAAVAVGTCASELGLAGFGPAATCEQWDSLSEALGASPGGSGGSASDIGAFFGGRGYCQHVAYDGPLESACEEAAAALGRGCNVFLVYTGAGGRHMEHVDGVAVDATPDTRCTARTLSWGRSSTTTYEGRGAFTIGGKFSGKEDGARYGAESYLAGEGEGLFVYYCPC